MHFYVRAILSCNTRDEIILWDILIHDYFPWIFVLYFSSSHHLQIISFLDLQHSIRKMMEIIPKILFTYSAKSNQKTLDFNFCFLLNSQITQLYFFLPQSEINSSNISFLNKQNWEKKKLKIKSHSRYSFGFGKFMSCRNEIRRATGEL